MDQLLLSFVVPVYNVDKYLRECLDSIFDEPVNNDKFEVIAIDDGSTDSSPEILKTYTHHKNFRIITQKNAGPSVARNAGIKAASGKYIAFIDSDDFLLPGGVPSLVGFARQSDSDIIEFGHKVTWETSIEIKNFQPTLNRSPMSGRGKVIFPQWRDQCAFMTVVWVRIYKRNLLIDNSLFFYPNIIHGDDEWIYRCFFYAASVILYPVAIYNYRRRDGSISFMGRQNMHKHSEHPVSFLSSLNMYKRCKDIFIIIDSLVIFTSKLENHPENDAYLRSMKNVIANLYRINVNFLSSDKTLPTVKRNELITELTKRRYILKFMTGSKNKYLYWFLKILHPCAALKFYNVIMRF